MPVGQSKEPERFQQDTRRSSSPALASQMNRSWPDKLTYSQTVGEVFSQYAAVSFNHCRVAHPRPAARGGYLVQQRVECQPGCHSDRRVQIDHPMGLETVAAPRLDDEGAGFIRPIR